MSAEHDLLSSLLNTEWAYPWDPAMPESAAYFEAAEAEAGADWDDAAMAEATMTGWQRLSQQLDQKWSEASQSALVNRLQQRFQTSMPIDLLQRLAAAATQLTHSGQPLVDQLVGCVEGILADWQAEDLAVLARPMAFSLRDGRSEIVELQLRSLGQTAWGDLSALEQARLSLAIASVALKEMAAES